jgi:hypothetical protein
MLWMQSACFHTSVCWWEIGICHIPNWTGPHVKDYLASTGRQVLFLAGTHRTVAQAMSLGKRQTTVYWSYMGIFYDQCLHSLPVKEMTSGTFLNSRSRTGIEHRYKEIEATARPAAISDTISEASPGSWCCSYLSRFFPYGDRLAEIPCQYRDTIPVHLSRYKGLDCFLSVCSMQPSLVHSQWAL